MLKPAPVNAPSINCSSRIFFTRIKHQPRTTNSSPQKWEKQQGVENCDIISVSPSFCQAAWNLKRFLQTQQKGDYCRSSHAETKVNILSEICKQTSEQTCANIWLTKSLELVRSPSANNTTSSLPREPFEMRGTQTCWLSLTENVYFERWGVVCFRNSIWSFWVPCAGGMKWWSSSWFHAIVVFLRRVDQLLFRSLEVCCAARLGCPSTAVLSDHG